MTKTPLFKLYPGIGDIAFILMKLQAKYPEFDIEISNQEPKRGLDFVQGIRGVGSAKYGNFSLRDVALRSISAQQPLPINVPTEGIYVEVNTWLESGRNIEDAFQKAPTSWELKLKEDKENDHLVDALLEGSELPVGIHSSGQQNAAWHLFSAEEWFTIIENVAKQYPTSTIFIINSSLAHDRDYNAYILEKLKKGGIRYVDCTKYAMPTVCRLLKKLKSFISFPSGLGILASIFSTPTIMFMPDSLKKMQYTWVDRKLVEEGKFVHILASQKNEIFDLLKKKEIPNL